MRCSILCVLIFVLQLVHVQLQGQHPWANSTLLTVETAENCLRECRFVKALCVNDVRIFECYAFAFNVMHPQCAQESKLFDLGVRSVLIIFFHLSKN